VTYHEQSINFRGRPCPLPQGCRAPGTKCFWNIVFPCKNCWT